MSRICSHFGFKSSWFMRQRVSNIHKRLFVIPKAVNEHLITFPLEKRGKSKFRLWIDDYEVVRQNNWNTNRTHFCFSSTKAVLQFLCWAFELFCLFFWRLDNFSFLTHICVTFTSTHSIFVFRMAKKRLPTSNCLTYHRFFKSFSSSFISENVSDERFAVIKTFLTGNNFCFSVMENIQTKLCRLCELLPFHFKVT